MDEMKAGFVEEAKCDPDEQLVVAYAQEVRQTIGLNEQAPLLELRSSGLISLHNALKHISSNVAVRAEQTDQVSLQ
ncbi:hypothetical protein ACWGS9_30055 [Bradyrhizobium sp. Arg314]